tara:strand:- start:1289 stop:1834 length:546 start_codon:yes stop_codon:yes gene_type:complete
VIERFSLAKEVSERNIMTYEETQNTLYRQGFQPKNTLSDLVGDKASSLIAPTLQNVDTGLKTGTAKPRGEALTRITNPHNAYLQPLTNPMELVCEASTEKQGEEVKVIAEAVILMKDEKSGKLHVASARYTGVDKQAKTVFTKVDWAIKAFTGYIGQHRTPLYWSLGAEFKPEIQQQEVGN